MFNFGSSVVLGVSTKVMQDAWIALMLSLVAALPCGLMYARIIDLNPGADLFTALERSLGKVAGKVVVALMAWYSLHLCALVLRNFSEFIQIASLMETPQLPVLLLLLTSVCYLAKSGPKALGVWSMVATPVLLLVVLLTVILPMNAMDPENILPVFAHTPKEIALEAYQIFSFPFGETIMLLSIADYLSTDINKRKLYLLATLVSALVLLVIILRNLAMLGAAVVAVEYFPSYVAARIISLGDFLSRIEGSISVNLIVGGITKIALSLTAFTRGVTRLFGLADYKRMVLPCALTAVALAMILYKNTMEMFAFFYFYAPYATVFQVVLPGILWVVSEVRARMAKSNAA